MKLKKMGATVLAAAMLAAVPVASSLFDSLSVTTRAAETETEIDLDDGTKMMGYYNYLVNPDGTVRLMGYFGSDSNVVIPDTLNGKKVTSMLGRLRKEGFEVFFGESSRATLESITIPDSVTGIGSGTFLDCTMLKEIVVDENNEKYCSVDGVLFNKDKTELICYPARKKGTSYVIPDSVTEIYDYAFYGCTSLESVTIPDSVTEIGDSAFKGCTSLKSATIPDSVTDIWGAFSGCTSLENVTIPDSVTEIGSAFDGCTSLKSVTIPDSVAYIGWYAFRGCTSLENVTIPDNVTEIRGFAFDGCTSLKSVTIPNNVTKIGENAFYDCTSLKSVIIPDGMTEIGNFAFCNCTSLESVTIPDSMTKIGVCAFCNCTSLESVTIPDNVTKIGHGAFVNCTRLEEIVVDENNENYSSVDGVLFNKDKTELICYPAGKKDTSYVIPDSVTVIDENALNYCAALEEIVIDENNENYSSVDGVLFNKDKSELICYSAGKKDTSYVIPDSVTKIVGGAFGECIMLESVTIPDSVTEIGYSAFMECTALERVNYTGTEEEWAAIYIAENNELLTNAVIKFNFSAASEPAAVAPGSSDKPAQSPGDGNQSTGTDQQPTGMTLAIAPVMLAAGAAIVLSKKRK